MGFLIFEYGAVRYKNSQTVLIKSLVIFALALGATFSFGFAFAYGDAYYIGTKYFFTSAFEDDDGNEEL